MPTEAKFLLNTLTKPDRLTLDSRLTQSPLDPTISTTIASILFLATRVVNVRTISILRRTKGALLRPSVTDIGYYIRGRQTFITWRNSVPQYSDYVTGRTTEIRFPVRQGLSLCHNLQTGFLAHPVFLYHEYRVFIGVNRPGPEADHSHPVLK
jgi:hypothetical protein